jgi:hypothetical protein
LPHTLTWWRGWIHSLGLNDGTSETGKAAVARRQLLRCLRTLRLHWAEDDDDSGLSELLKANCFAHVRVFQAGADDSDQCWFNGTVPLSRYLDKMPRLEELHLYERSLPFSRNFPHLRKLTAYHGMDEYPLEKLAANTSLKNLTQLACWPRGQSNEGPDEPNQDGGRAYISRSGAVALFRSRNLPSLQHLQLCNSDIGDEGIRALVASGLLKRLTTLDLLGGCVTDEGARLLAGCPDVCHLEALNLSENMLTSAGIAALKATGVPLTANYQLGMDALESGQYLWSGDCE